MTNELIAAAKRLADALAEENAALAALDLPRAASLLAAKQNAVAGFLAARDAQPCIPEEAVIATLVRRLQSLSEENRTLLEQAIAVQGRVIGIIARAALPAVAPSGYAPRPAQGHVARPTAFALAARA